MDSFLGNSKLGHYCWLRLRTSSHFGNRRFASMR